MENLIKELKKHKEGRKSLEEQYNEQYFFGYMEALDFAIALVQDKIKKI